MRVESGGGTTGLRQFGFWDRVWKGGRNREREQGKLENMESGNRGTSKREGMGRGKNIQAGVVLCYSAQWTNGERCCWSFRGDEKPFFETSVASDCRLKKEFRFARSVTDN